MCDFEKIAFLNKYKEILTRIEGEATQKLQNMMPSVQQVFAAVHLHFRC